MKSALTQYLDLYRAHSALIEANSAGPLNAWRPKALDALGNMALPPLGSEDYAHTDLNELLIPDFALNLARVPLDVNPADSFRCDVPNMSTSLFMLLNDQPAETDRARNGLPEGVLAGSLRQIAASHPDIVERYYNRLADPANPTVSLNTLLAQDGFMLYVPDNTVVEKPLQLVDILSYTVPYMAVRRILIVIGDNAEAKLLVCDHTQTSGIGLLSLQTVEIFAGRDSRFDWYEIEESSEQTVRLSSLYLSQEAGSNVMIDGITLFNGTTRNEYYCRLKGEGASLSLLGMGIEDRGRRLDNHTLISHDAPRCTSNELFKYVVDDTARGAFSGRIYVAEGASKTEAYQANRNIVGSPEARMFSKPQLEIYNDDVKCSHGSAIGQLDEMQVFYLRTRGLSEAEAKLLLKQAFMSDVIDGVRLPSLRDRLRQLVERRFNGEPMSGCASCHSECPAPKL